MKALRQLLICTAFALAGLPAWGALELDDQVAYLPGAQPDTPACAWEAGMASALVAGAKGAVTPAGAAASSGDRLSLEVARLTATRKPGKGGDYEVVVRGNIVRNGKLLATRDFQEDKSFKNDQPACDALKALGTTFGQKVSEWAAATKLMDCGDGCTGIHPEEPIVVGEEVLLAFPDAINDTVRNDCRWQREMVKRVVKDFNETDEPPPRAKLEVRAIDVQAYTGRRLLLRVKEVHALGGGGNTGAKWMSMSGELREGDTLVASFDSHSTSGRGLTTCRSVDSLSDSTSYMIINWLRSPTLGAQLK